METREDDDRMLHAAHASRFHWGEAPECRPENLARGEWQISRVYVRARPGGAGGVARAAVPRAGARRPGSATGTSRTRTRRWRVRMRSRATRPKRTHGSAKAREAGDAIADPEDREHFDEDFATL